MTGTYSIIYSVADGVGNIATATRTVNVVPAVVVVSPPPSSWGGVGGGAGAVITYSSAPAFGSEMVTWPLSVGIITPWLFDLKDFKECSTNQFKETTESLILCRSSIM